MKHAKAAYEAAAGPQGGPETRGSEGGARRKKKKREDVVVNDEKENGIQLGALRTRSNIVSFRL